VYKGQVQDQPQTGRTVVLLTWMRVDWLSWRSWIDLAWVIDLHTCVPFLSCSFLLIPIQARAKRNRMLVSWCVCIRSFPLCAIMYHCIVLHPTLSLLASPWVWYVYGKDIVVA